MNTYRVVFRNNNIVVASKIVSFNRDVTPSDFFRVAEEIGLSKESYNDFYAYPI